MSRELTLRVISSLIALALYFGLNGLFGVEAVLGLGMMVIGIGLGEYIRVTLRPAGISRWFEALIFFLTLLILVNEVRPLGGAANFVWSLSFIFLVLAVFTLSGRATSYTEAIRVLLPATFGFVYFGTMAAAALKLLFLENGFAWLTTLLLIAFSGDIMAYFFGRWWGRAKLMPGVSPGKTRVGALAGLMASTVIAMPLGLGLGQAPFWFWALVGAAAGTAEQAGDLLISTVKRSAHAKDSGHIMPGHGGVLDRFDGVFFAAPVLLLAAHLQDILF